MRSQVEICESEWRRLEPKPILEQHNPEATLEDGSFSTASKMSFTKGQTGPNA